MSSGFPDELRFTRSTALLHVVSVVGFLTIILGFGFLLDDEGNTWTEVVEATWTLTNQFVLPTYLHFAVWTLTIRQRRWGFYAIGSASIVLGWPFVVNSGVLDFFAAGTGDSYLQVALNTFFGILFATGIRAIYRSFTRDRDLRELQRRQTESELAGLRAQVNPHFLFNTLNNIYGVNLDDPERGSAMLLELAEVMRYHYDLSSHREVALSQEVDLIRSVVQLERLRLRENTTVTLDLPADTDLRGLRVPPLLLVPFVENAFKHGTHPAHAGEVYVRLVVAPDHLDFETHNPVYPDRQTVSTGVGVANVRKRLELMYGEEYELTSVAEADVWRVRLRIPVRDLP